MRGRQRARRRRRDELEEEEQLHHAAPEPEPEQRASAPSAVAHKTLADKALDLQKTAGNRAVGAALQRQPGAAPSTAHGEATFDDELKVPVLSVQQQDPPPGGRSREDEVTYGELVIITPTGEHSVTLQQALIQGKTYAQVVIVVGGARIILTNVMISSVQMSGEHQSWSLHFSKREFAH